MKRTGIGIALAAALALAAVRCGGSSSNTGGTGGTDGGTGGTDGGTGGTSSSQIAFITSPTTCSGVSLAGVFVGIADRAVSGACNAVSTGCTEYKNLNTILVGVQNFTTTGTATAVTPGTYTVGVPSSASGTFALAGRSTTDANCVDTSPSASASGTVTITSVSSSAVVGSYNVTIGGQNFSGSFSAPVCSTSFGGNVCNGDVGGTCTGTKQCI